MEHSNIDPEDLEIIRTIHNGQTVGDTSIERVVSAFKNVAQAGKSGFVVTLGDIANKGLTLSFHSSNSPSEITHFPLGKQENPTFENPATMKKSKVAKRITGTLLEGLENQ